MHVQKTILSSTCEDNTNYQNLLIFLLFYIFYMYFPTFPVFFPAFFPLKKGSAPIWKLGCQNGQGRLFLFRALRIWIIN